MMTEDVDALGEYKLPAKYEVLLRERHFTYISVSGVADRDLSKFIIWLPKPKAEVRARAEAFIRKVYEKNLSYHSYPRNYIDEARKLARIGLHEDASIETIKRAFAKSREERETSRRTGEEWSRQYEAKLAAERKDAQPNETGTFLGALPETSVSLWVDQFGYTHAAPPWMHGLLPGQRFIAGTVLNFGSVPELSPIQSSKALSDADLRTSLEVTATPPSQRRGFVLRWQKGTSVNSSAHIHQAGDPFLQVVEYEKGGTYRFVGRCPSSLFLSRVTEDSQLHEILMAWGVSPDSLDAVRAWIRVQAQSYAGTYSSRHWPLSRMAVRNQADLAALGERRVTLYLPGIFNLFGRQRIEATNFQVTRVEYAQYVDAFRIRFRPRGAMYDRELIQTYRPDLVALLGWGHPELKQDDRAVGFYGERNTCSSSDRRWEEEFDAALRFYLETHPVVRIVADLRGELVHDKNGKTEGGSIPAIPSELKNSIVPTSFTSTGNKDQNVPRRSVFLSYHHERDAVERARFETEFRSLFESVSVYTGEIGGARSETSIKREIRARIQEADFLIVLVGKFTHTRKWVDFEIRTALHTKQSGGPCPVMGVLTAELSSAANDIRGLIDATRFQRLPAAWGKEAAVRQIADSLNAQLLSAHGITLPERLLDNLLVDYAVLVDWPTTQEQLSSLLAALQDRRKTPLNGRKLKREGARYGSIGEEDGEKTEV
jgi:hypothetical protein